MNLTPTQQTELAAVFSKMSEAAKELQTLIGRMTSWYRGEEFLYKLPSGMVEVRFAACKDIDHRTGRIEVEVEPRARSGEWSQRAYRVNLKDLQPKV